MIRGYIDFDLLDRSTPIPAAALARAEPVAIAGLELVATNGRFQIYENGMQRLLIVGTPHIREARLHQKIKLEGWAAVVPWLFAAPQDVLNHLGGRFSLLWLDNQNGRLGLASDRFNTYGFCYAQQGRRFSFADRADQVPVASRAIDNQALFDYLYFHVIPAPRTVFEGVRRLQPGAMIVAHDGGAEEKTWWRAQFDEPDRADFKHQAESFRTILQEAVNREVADTQAQGGQAGAFLSGGTDSSTIVGMLAKTQQSPIKAYSIGFEAEGYDEMEYARIAAKHFGVDHRAYYVTPDDLVAGIPKVAAHYDQPFGNSSALPAYYCAKLAHDEGITKMLAGDGGDELFGGNTRYAKQRVFGYYDRVPAAFKQGVLEPILRQKGVRNLPLLSKAASYVDQANIKLPHRLEQYNLLYRLGIDAVLTPQFIESVDLQAPVHLQQRVWDDVFASAQINKLLGFDWRFTLADNDLPKVIGTTQLAGVDVAFPFMDDDLVDFSLALPPKFKLKGLKLRWFFKEALRGFLPDQILTKKKHGFGLPFGPWTIKHQGLQTLARHSMESLAERGIIRADFLHTLFGRYLPEHPGYYGEMVWIAMMLEQWLQAHDSSNDLPPSLTGVRNESYFRQTQ